jgi:hypothetical protein
MQQSRLDGFARSVSAADARPNSVLAGQPQWKFTSSQARTLTRYAANWILRDGGHTSDVEGDGIKEFVRMLEPRFVLPSRTYFSHV